MEKPDTPKDAAGVLRSSGLVRPISTRPLCSDLDEAKEWIEILECLSWRFERRQMWKEKEAVEVILPAIWKDRETHHERPNADISDRR